jgi:hypothetical protein
LGVLWVKIEIRKRILFSFCVLLSIPTTTYATTPTVSIESMVDRADVILVASIFDFKQIIPPRRLSMEENWLRNISLTAGKNLELLKNESTVPVPSKVYFFANSLVFEAGAKYILFLKRSSEFGEEARDVYLFIDGPTERIDASAKSVAEIKKILNQR